MHTFTLTANLNVADIETKEKFIKFGFGHFYLDILKNEVISDPTEKKICELARENAEIHAQGMKSMRYVLVAIMSTNDHNLIREALDFTENERDVLSFRYTKNHVHLPK